MSFTTLSEAITRDTHFHPDDIHLFNEGRHFHLHRKLGAHPAEENGKPGVRFSVWAPNARAVSVIGNFNGWNKQSHPLEPVQSSGIWSGFIEGLGAGEVYKYFIESHHHGYTVEKADPVAFYAENPPKTASVVWQSSYVWNDGDWMHHRRERQGGDKAMAIYEVHPGSWARKPEEGNRMLTYRELAETLPAYVKDMGYTHIELLPVMEHPFYGSWGYQITGYFAPTSRYGTPDDFKYFVDQCHAHGIGVLLDWVPSHFPNDEHGLAYFDGTHLFEHADTRQGFHPDWNSLIFNYGRNEVRSFLISSALFWLEEYHIDGIRVDAVASMLYLDYSRNEGEWIPNEFGGRENLQGMRFLKELNEALYGHFPDIHTIAEESTAWAMVSRPTYVGGLGFGMKWDMGWMHDTLHYFRKDPIHRSYHQNELTFRMIYAFNENFVLSLSHDEVVHGKRSLPDNMPGDVWQKMANLRCLFAYMYAQPGKKLLFMGMDFAQWREWSHENSLDWHLTGEAPHQGIQTLVRTLNHLYRNEPALHEQDFSHEGFEWLDAGDAHNCVLSFFRYDRKKEQVVLCIFNLTPVPRDNYRLGVSRAGKWHVILNSDDPSFWGSGYTPASGYMTEDLESHGRPFSLDLNLPPLGVLYLKWDAMNG